MRRVAVVITARPSYSRIKSALDALKGRVELQIVAAASAVVTRFGRISDQIKADGFDVTAEVSSVVEEDSLSNSALSTGVLLTQLSGLFASLKPDVVVTIADRHETLATAIAASYQHIPLCHVQGGEVTGSIDDKVRNAITQLADVHCVSTEMAALFVARRKQPKSVVHVTGCPSIDLALDAERLGPIPSGRVVVLQHPVTNEPESGEQMQSTIDAVGPEALYFWPGEDAGAAHMSKALRMAGIQPVRNMPPVEFLRTLMGARCLVGNSSVGIRECSFLRVPVVNVGSRQAGRQRAGNVIDAPHDRDAIEASVIRWSHRSRPERSVLYGDGRSGERIADVLLGKAAERAA